MPDLRYCEDYDGKRDRLTTWWHGGDLGRPAILLVVRDQPPKDPLPPVAQPANWGGRYDWKSLDYRVHLGEHRVNTTRALGEYIEFVSPDLGPNCLALYLGCPGDATNDTVWFHPCIDDPDRAVFRYDPTNFYWDFTLRLTRAFRQRGQGRYPINFPDLIEGLDTLAAMRDTQTLLVDLVERPDWVHQSLRTITDLYFHYYDLLYDLIRDNRGGSLFWHWAPGRMAKLQCDFSAMIGPDMFKEFMVPVLDEMSQRLGYCTYHWDGPEALVHQDHLLKIPGLKTIQWQPGVHEPCWDRRWWPLYHKILDHGKNINIGVDTLENLLILKKEFGLRLKRFIIGMKVPSETYANDVLQRVTFQ